LNRDSTLQVPGLAIEYFDASLRQIVIKFRYRLPQSIPGFPLGQGLGDNPHAELVVFQSGFEIRQQHVEQVLSALVKVAKMRSPRPVSYYADT